MLFLGLSKGKEVNGCSLASLLALLAYCRGSQADMKQSTTVWEGRTLGKFTWPHTHLFFSQEPPFLVPLHVHADLGLVCAVQVRHLLAGHSK